VHVYLGDEHHTPATEGASALLNPVLGYISVYKNMKVSNAALVKFKNSNVFDWLAVLATQIQSKLVEHAAQIPDGVALNVRGVQRQGKKTR